jgi:hypothetical protein
MKKTQAPQPEKKTKVLIELSEVAHRGLLDEQARRQLGGSRTRLSDVAADLLEKFALEAG